MTEDQQHDSAGVAKGKEGWWAPVESQPILVAKKPAVSLRGGKKRGEGGRCSEGDSERAPGRRLPQSTQPSAKLKAHDLEGDAHMQSCHVPPNTVTASDNCPRPSCATIMM